MYIQYIKYELALTSSSMWFVLERSVLKYTRILLFKLSVMFNEYARWPAFNNNESRLYTGIVDLRETALRGL